MSLGGGGKSESGAKVRSAEKSKSGGGIVAGKVGEGLRVDAAGIGRVFLNLGSGWVDGWVG